MDENRHTTILFADVSESTKLYEAAGDHVAHEAIGRCIEAMRASTQMTGGRVVKTIGDEILAVFGSADAAAAAASEMQVVVNMMKPVADRKLGLRIGFHSGPVLQENDDVFGDTVNIAARLVAQAVKGQIITSAETAALLGPVVRSSTRDLYAIEVKGKTEDVKLCELVWRRNDEDTTVLSTGRPLKRRGAAKAIHLKYRGKELVRRRDNDSVTLGRDPDCGIMIADHMASRHHCTIERRQDKWVLKDHSTNGTYVTLDGDENELVLQREELTLRKHGYIAFGQTRAAAEEVVEFDVE
jgi:adenylate cyclase